MSVLDISTGEEASLKVKLLLLDRHDRILSLVVPFHSGNDALIRISKAKEDVELVGVSTRKMCKRAKFLLRVLTMGRGPLCTK